MNLPSNAVTMSKRIFLSDEHQQTFERQGFIVQPFLIAQNAMMQSFVPTGLSER